MGWFGSVIWDTLNVNSMDWIITLIQVFYSEIVQYFIEIFVAFVRNNIISSFTAKSDHSRCALPDNCLDTSSGSSSSSERISKSSITKSDSAGALAGKRY